MTEERSYLAILGPRAARNQAHLIYQGDLLFERLEELEYQVYAFQTLNLFYKDKIKDWVTSKTEEEAEQIIEELSLPLHGTPINTLRVNVDELSEAYDPYLAIHPLLAMIGKDVLKETIASICHLYDDGSIGWEGNFSTSWIDLEGESIALLTTGGKNNPETRMPRAPFEAFTIIKGSKIFEKPFDELNENWKR